jgi:hypothetical protein
MRRQRATQVVTSSINSTLTSRAGLYFGHVVVSACCKNPCEDIFGKGGTKAAMTFSSFSRVLVLVKAAPQPSRQYGDTVCVAGVDVDAAVPRWIRLYPVPFRYLEGERQFRKYEVITVRTRDAGADKRPESRKIDAENLVIGGHLADWSQRSAWVEPLAGPTMCQLVQSVRTDLNAPSLGAVRLAAGPTLKFSDHPGWSKEELARFDAYRNQGDLFREAPPTLLDAPRLVVHMEYRCQEQGCAGHLQKIIDWELTALQLRFQRKSSAELKAAITRNFLDIPFADDRNPMVFVGNQENVRRRTSFTVLGVYYPRKADIERTELLF